MKHLINIVFFLFFSVQLISQSGLELRYFNNQGISLGLDDNRFTRIDYKKKKHNIGFSNTLFPASDRRASQLRRRHCGRVSLWSVTADREIPKYLIMTYSLSFYL